MKIKGLKKGDFTFKYTLTIILLIYLSITLLFLKLLDKNFLIYSFNMGFKSNYLLLIYIVLNTSFIIGILYFIMFKMSVEKTSGKYRAEINEEANEKIRAYKHDFMNHLQILQSLIELDYKDRAIKYIQNLSSEARNPK